MAKIKVEYQPLMSMLAYDGGTATANLTINDGTKDFEVLTVELDETGVLCYQHGGDLEILPITIDLLFSEDSWFEVEV